MKFDTTWKQPGTAIVHRVVVQRARGPVRMRRGGWGFVTSRNPVTDCGVVVKPLQLRVAGDGPVNCVPCLEAAGHLGGEQVEETSDADRARGWLRRVFEREPVAA